MVPVSAMPYMRMGSWNATPKPRSSCRTKEIPELARSFGKATAEYEKARIQAKKEIQQLKNQGSLGREKLESIAETLGIDYTNKNDDELRAAIDLEINKSKQ